MTTLDDIQNKSMFELAELFMTNENLPTNLKKYAYRSIIWRLVIDKLLNDQLFHEFVNIRDVFEKKVALDYIRKILTILYNYSQETTYSYMSLTDLLKQLYPDQDNVSQWFCSEICKQERERICRLLYFMNYYDRRDNNWFQFVDIQCNSQIKNKEAKTVDEDGIRYLSGVNCVGTMVFDEFMATKNLFGNLDNQDFKEKVNSK